MQAWCTSRIRNTEPMETESLIDFQKDPNKIPWIIVNDDVMGGHSNCSMTVSGNQAIFAGTLSLENGGGFASTRTMLKGPDLSGFCGICIRVMGDGRCYQLRLRQDSDYEGVAFRREFRTVEGEWTDIVLAFSEFEASFRGRSLPELGPPVPEKIRQVGFLIADGQPGPFRLIVKSIVAYREV